MSALALCVGGPNDGKQVLMLGNGEFAELFWAVQGEVAPNHPGICAIHVSESLTAGGFYRRIITRARGATAKVQLLWVPIRG